jgi:quercetin dioxygenase-like cupin family protein
VINSTESAGRDHGPLGAGCAFQGEQPFRQVGVNLNVLQPGRPLAMYHRENHQKGFLVLAGECLAIVEGQERALATWDYLHCPGGTAHPAAEAYAALPRAKRCPYGEGWLPRRSPT